MARQTTESEFQDLIPEIRSWNDGASIDVEGWIACEGRIELAIGYSSVFWPRFVMIDDCVLRAGSVEASFREWERAVGDLKTIEAVINHWHILDLHHVGSPATEAQIRYLGRVLKDVHEAKLRSEFPDRTFVVSFNDEPGLELIDYELTFWQVRPYRCV